MSHPEFIQEILGQLLKATQIVANRFTTITSAEDFVNSDAGLEKLDAICMQLIVIGESVKHLDKITGGSLLVRYPQVEWKRIMGMQDILTHHYFDLDEEIVYSVCANYLGILQQTIETMLADLSSE